MHTYTRAHSSIQSNTLTHLCLLLQSFTLIHTQTLTLVPACTFRYWHLHNNTQAQTLSYSHPGILWHTHSHWLTLRHLHIHTLTPAYNHTKCTQGICHHTYSHTLLPILSHTIHSNSQVTRTRVTPTCT